MTMLRSIDYILTIASYERRMLYRTPKFWVLAAAGGVFITLFLTAVTIGSILDTNPPSAFMLEGTDSYLALYFFSYLQALLIILVAGDFRKAEEKARLDQVMLSRPMTTANWVLGKYAGVVSALVYLNLALLLIALIGRLIKASFAGVGVNLVIVLQYFVLVSVPAILFMAALVFFLVSLLRSQAVAIILCTAYAAAILLFFQHDYLGLFDYACFFAPIFASDLIGFGDLSHILPQRLFFAALGISLVGFSIILYPRLRQSKLSQSLSALAAVIFLAIAAAAALHLIVDQKQSQQAFAAARDAQLERTQQPVCQVLHYDLDVRFAGDAPLAIDARLAIRNPHEMPLPELVFALNGELRVHEVRRGDGEAVPFRQQHQLLLVDCSEAPLAPGAGDTLYLRYAGAIDAEAFMLQVVPDSKTYLSREDGPWFFGSLPAYLDRNFAVLPAQSGWYPQPGVVVSPAVDETPKKQFATARIRVEADSALTPITQGVRREVQDDGRRRRTTFISEIPLPQFSLNLGRYQRLARRFQQTEVEIYYHQNHLRDLDVFADIADTCFQVVERMFEIMQEITGQPYPFPKLAYVEVPLHLQVFAASHSFVNTVQPPEIAMISELRLAGGFFKNVLDRQTKRARQRREDDSPERIKRQVFIDAVETLLFGRNWRQSFDMALVSPLRNHVVHQIDLADPMLARGLDLQLFEMFERSYRNTFYPGEYEDAQSFFDRIRRGESWWLQRNFDNYYGVSVDTVMAVLEKKPLTALQEDTSGGLYLGAVDFKASPVLHILAKTLGEANFAAGLRDLVQQYRHQRVSRAGFLRVMQAHSQRPIGDFFTTWFAEPTFPGYRILSAEAEKIDTGNMKIRYLVTAQIANGETGDGFVQVVFRTENDRVYRDLALAGHEVKEIKITLPEPPRSVDVLPFFSRNRGRISSAVSLAQRVRRSAPVDTAYAVTATVDSLIFYTDDRDDGFFTPVAAESKYLRPPLRGKSWWEFTNPQAYGRYYSGWRYKRGGSGDYPARWETQVPRTGTYDLSFHLPIRNDWWSRNLSRNFNVTVVTAAGPQEVDFRAIETADNWIFLGRFYFERDKPAVVELSDASAGYLLADAIRWEYVQ